MKAQKLLEGGAFDDKQLKAIKQAFEEAWAAIAPQVSQRPIAIEAARLKLASIVMSVAKRGTLDPKKLTDEALKLMFASPAKL